MVYSDKKGRFEFLDIKPGDYRVTYSRELHGGWFGLSAQTGDDVPLRTPPS